MIHYHGSPITSCYVALQVFKARHAFISFADTRDISLAARVCQSFALDNGAFPAWKSGKTVDFDKYSNWVSEWWTHPGFDFCVIPDVIDGNEEDNDKLLDNWRFPKNASAPVWHLHESIERLERLAKAYPRICLGSSGEYSAVGNKSWWLRMDEALEAITTEGRPICKLHGLRMLNPAVFSKLPLSSADSTNVARNHKDLKRAGHYIILDRIESVNSASRWVRSDYIEGGLF